MSLITQAFVVEHYGLRLNVEQLAAVFSPEEASSIKTYVDCGTRFADYRDVAERIEAIRAEARAARDTWLPDLRAKIEQAERQRRIEAIKQASTDRYLAEVQQTPPWADQKAIEAIYADCRRVSAETGELHHVDHELPLRGRLVSGLHVETNLRVLPAGENMRKTNRFEIE